MNINYNTLENLISQAKFAEHGDDQEKESWDILNDNFPNCEEFWRRFVVPLTCRIRENNDTLGKNIHFRDDIDDELRHIASAHYSIFMHLVYAHHHIKSREPSWFENLYGHLYTVCDLVETVLVRWYLLRLKCHNEQSKTLQMLTRDEFLGRAGEVYDAMYENAYQNYLDNGKFMRIEVVRGDDLLKEYFGDRKEREDYARLSSPIRQYRNIMVHDIKLGRVIYNKEILVPKLDAVGKYRAWKEVEKATQNADTIRQDFCEQSKQAANSLAKLERCLNALWTKLIGDVSDEFFSSDRELLRQLAGITFTQDYAITVVEGTRNEPIEEHPTIASGTYSSYIGVLSDFGTDNSTDSTTIVEEVDEES